jgi:flagellar hook-length control protein FliK
MTLVPIKGGPTDAALTTVSAGTTAPGPGASSPGDFLAAMLQALAPAPATADAATEDPEAASEVVGEDAAAAGLVAVVPLPGLVAALVGGTGSTVAPGHPNVAGGTAVSPMDATGDIRTSGYVDGAAGAPAVAPGTIDGGMNAVIAPTAAAPAIPTERSGSATGATEIVAQRTEVVAQRTDGPAGVSMPGTDTSTEMAVDPSAVTAPRADTGVTSGSQAAPAASQPPAANLSTPVAPAAPSAGSADVTPAQQVARQVIPEVTSLVSRGDGTHRITLSLNPEALGEVRVVMTVRDGSVHVRLAAGHEAHQALLEGSPELTRLLEQAGATETRVVVRDLGSASTSPSAGLGAGGTGQQDQHAGTRAHHPATDGTHDGSTGHTRATPGTNPPRSNEPVTHTRTAGVDVTM